MSGWRATSGSYGQQLLVEATEAPGAIDKMDLEDPVSSCALGIGLADAGGIAVSDRETRRLSGRRRFMWKMPDQVARRRRPELPALRFGQCRHEIVELPARQVGCRLIKRS